MTDIFRKKFGALTEDQKDCVNKIKTKAEELIQEFEWAAIVNPDARCMAVAKTKLEETVMWAVKAVTVT